MDAREIGKHSITHRMRRFLTSEPISYAGVKCRKALTPRRVWLDTNLARGFLLRVPENYLMDEEQIRKAKEMYGPNWVPPPPSFDPHAALKSAEEAGTNEHVLALLKHLVNWTNDHDRKLINERWEAARLAGP